MTTVDLIGCWVTVLAKKGFEDEVWAAAVNCDPALVGFNDKHDRIEPGFVHIDRSPPDWQSGSTAVQWMYECKKNVHWTTLRQSASTVIQSIHAALEPENETGPVFGADILLLGKIIEGIEGDDAAIAKAITGKSPVLRLTIDGVNVDVMKPADIEENPSISVGIATWRQDLSDEATRSLLLGVGGALILPALLGHKVAWLARQALMEPEQEKIDAAVSSVNNLADRACDAISRPSELGPFVKRASEEAAVISRIRALVSDIVADLKIQRHHLHYQVKFDRMAQLYRLYGRHAGEAIARVTALVRQIQIAHQSLKDVFLIARARLVAFESEAEAARERRWQTLEVTVAAFGIGIAAAELFSDNWAAAMLRGTTDVAFDEKSSKVQLQIVGVRAITSFLIALVSLVILSARRWFPMVVGRLRALASWTKGGMPKKRN